MKLHALTTFALLALTFTLIAYAQRPVGNEPGPEPVKNERFVKLDKLFAEVYASVESRLKECGVKETFRNYKTREHKFVQFYRLVSQLHLNEAVKIPGDPKEPCPETKQLHCLISKSQEALNEFTEDKEVRDYLRAEMRARPEKVDEILTTLRMINPSYRGDQLKDG